MPTVTILYAIALAALGGGFYFTLSPTSLTALIPVFFAIPVFLLGLLARNERYLKHAMHGAAMLGVLGVAGGAPGAIKLLRGVALERPAAAWEQAAMAGLSLVFVILCVRSFVAVRRARRGAGG
jgi:hypothetical protein